MLFQDPVCNQVVILVSLGSKCRRRVACSLHMANKWVGCRHISLGRSDIGRKLGILESVLWEHLVKPNGVCLGFAKA